MPDPIIIGGLYLTAKSYEKNKEDQMAGKHEKYSGLSPTELQKKHHLNRRKLTRDLCAATGAGGAACATGGFTAPLHGPKAVYHTYKADKHASKMELTEEVLKQRGIPQKDYKFKERVRDVYEGAQTGGLKVSFSEKKIK